MKNKKKVLLSSVLVIALCLSLIAGSTFALFTSESHVNIAVTSGKVNVDAEIKNPKIYSATVESKDEQDNAYEVAGEITSGNHAATYYYEPLTVTTDSETGNFNGVFTNTGTANYTATTNNLVLDRVTPGDRIDFDVEIANNSNVNIQYRVIVTVNSGLKIFNKMKVSIDGVLLTGVSRTGNWKNLEANGTIPSIPVKIYLPIGLDGEEYMNQSTSMTVSVEAVQGNAKTTNEILTTAIETEPTATTVANSKTTAENTQISDNDNLVTVVLPKDTVLTSETDTSLMVKVTPQETQGNITVLNNNPAKASVSYDVSVLKIVTETVGEETTTTTSDAISHDNEEKIRVTMFVGAGLMGVELYHYDDATDETTQITDFDYDSESGYITFETTSFSEYTVVYNANYSFETFDDEGNSTGIVEYKATEQTGVYSNEEGNPVTVVEENKDITLTSGNVSVFIPKEAKKDASLLTLKLTEFATYEDAKKADTDNKWYIQGRNNQHSLFYLLDIDGLSADNTVDLTWKFKLVEGATSSSVVDIASRPYVCTDTNKYNMVKTNAVVTDDGYYVVQTSSLGFLSTGYRLNFKLSDIGAVSLTDEVGDKIAKAELYNGTYNYGNIAKLVKDLKLTVEEDSAYSAYIMHEETDTVKTLKVSIDGLIFDRVKLELPIGIIPEDAINVRFYADQNVMKQSDVNAGNYYTEYDEENGVLYCYSMMQPDNTYSVTPAVKYISLVYTQLTDAEKSIVNAISNQVEGETLIIDIAELEDSVNLFNIQNALSGTKNVSLVGDENGHKVIISSGATVNAEGLTLKYVDITAKTTLTISGKNNSLENAVVLPVGDISSCYDEEGEFNVMSLLRYFQKNSLIFKGPDNKLNGVTIYSGSTIYGGFRDCAAVRFENDNDQADGDRSHISSSVTELNDVKIIAYYNDELKEFYGYDDVHEQYKDYSYTTLSSNGLSFESFYGTLKITNSIIDVANNGLYIGIDAEPLYGKVIVENSTINTQNLHFSDVATKDNSDSIIFKGVTFKNDWSDKAMELNYTTSSHLADYAFYDCDFEVALNFTGFGNANNDIRIRNCTYNGVEITADNIGDFLTVNRGYTVKVVEDENGTTIILTTK